MKSGIAPDEVEHFESKAATLGSLTDSRAPAGDGILGELSRLIERVSSTGVRSPVDEALLRGAREVFSSLQAVCEQLCEKCEKDKAEQASQEPGLSEAEEEMMNAMTLMAMAQLGTAMDEDAGPGQEEAAIKPAAKKAAKKKSTKKKAAKKKAKGASRRTKKKKN